MNNLDYETFARLQISIINTRVSNEIILKRSFDETKKQNIHKTTKQKMKKKGCDV